MSDSNSLQTATKLYVLICKLYKIPTMFDDIDKVLTTDAFMKMIIKLNKFNTDDLKYIRKGYNTLREITSTMRLGIYNDPFLAIDYPKSVIQYIEDSND